MRVPRLVGASLLTLALAGVACDDDDPVSPPTPTQFTAALLPGNERPTPVSNAPNATGTATFTLNASGTLDYTIVVSNLTSTVTACHIHGGSSAASGPVMITLCSAQTPAPIGTNVTVASGTLQEGGLNATTAGVSFMTTEGLIALFASGDVYVNVHTQTNGGGEVRGQVVPVTP